ncbi:armadillo repeat-containing protein 12 isoform X3 [Anser cygnoides]|uniref:armadillo repeat-containing protein 12 isoform X3 n=1 Tax=Anser cygnoides TaxID=8845 RepID=UPI0034D1EE0A
MAACWGTWTGRHVLSVATGAGAVYLLYRTVAEALSSAPGGTDRYRLESPDHQDGLPVEEVLSRRVCEELLEMLRAQQDGRSRSAILRSITRCVYLMDAKDYYPKILDLVISSRDTEVQVVALRLLNALPVPPNIEPLLRRAVPNLLGFLQWDNYAIQLQVLRLLIALSRKEELLPDILNCQVRPEFLSLMNNSQPGKLLCEMLLLVEVLHGGCAKPRRPSKSPKSGSCSLYEVLFGENSHLDEHLLVMFVHPEERVQLQACKLIMSLWLYKLDAEIAAAALGKHGAGSAASLHVSPSGESIF